MCITLFFNHIIGSLEGFCRLLDEFCVDIEKVSSVLSWNNRFSAKSSDFSWVIHVDACPSDLHTMISTAQYVWRILYVLKNSNFGQPSILSFEIYNLDCCQECGFRIRKSRCQALALVSMHPLFDHPPFSGICENVLPLRLFGSTRSWSFKGKQSAYGQKKTHKVIRCGQFQPITGLLYGLFAQKLSRIFLCA